MGSEMCIRDRSIDMLVESTLLHSPERRRSLLCKESSEKTQSKGVNEKGSKRKLLVKAEGKENDSTGGRNGNIEDYMNEDRPKRKRIQVKAFSPRFTGKHLDCTAQ